MTVTMSCLRVKYVSKKVSVVRWRPNNSFITGSWNDKVNKVAVWNCPESFMSKDLSNIDVADPHVIAESSFSGGATDLEVALNDLIFVSTTLGSLHIYKYEKEKLELHKTWDKVHSFACKTAPATSISVKGNDVASGGEDGCVFIFNFDKLQKVRKLESMDLCAFTSVSYLRHQEIIAGNVFGYLKIWDLRSNTELPSHSLMVSGDNVGISCMNPHPVQPHILATGHENGTMCIWDLRNGNRPVTLLPGHKATIQDIKFHPSNPDFLYTCTMDGAVWQWNASALAAANTDSVQSGTKSPWLNCDASKHRLDIISLFTDNKVCVNSLALDGTKLLWATDSEALYLYPNLLV